MATLFPTTGTMEGDIKAGIITNGVYNPNIDVSKITPTSPVKLPDTPASTDNYNAIIASLNTTLPEETAYKKTEGDVISKMKDLGGEATFQADQEKALGLDQNKQDLNNLTNELRTVNAEAQAAALNLDRQGTPTRLTAANTLDKQNIEKDRAIKALRISSSIQAIQGNIALATDQVARAVKLKYDPIRNDLEILNKQLQFNYNSFNAAEKKRADALKKANDIKLNEVKQQQKVENDFQQVKVEGLGNGMPVAIAQKAENLFNAGKHDEAYAVMTNYTGIASRQVIPKTTNIITSTTAKKYNLPQSLVGKSEQEVSRDLSSTQPPAWFIQEAEKKMQASLVPSYAESLWNKFRVSAAISSPTTTPKSKSSNSGGVDYGAFNLPPPVQ